MRRLVMIMMEGRNWVVGGGDLSGAVLLFGSDDDDGRT